MMTCMEKATLNIALNIARYSKDIKTLLRLQDIDASIRLLQRELASMPAREKEIHSAIEPFEERLLKSRELVKTRSANVKTLELEVSAMRERIAKIREQQLQAKTNREYQTLQVEIDKIQGNITANEDRQLAYLDEVDQAQAAAGESEAVMAKQKQTIAADLAGLNIRKMELEAELNKAQAERNTVGTAIENKDRLDYYNRVLANKGEAALVPVENGACGGCHLKLQPQLVHDAKRPDLITVCSYCGRMLFVREE